MRTFFHFLLLILPLTTRAHSISHTENVFAAGLFHPVLGYDHLLAMLCVGLLSTQLGRRAIWLVPLFFVLAMLVGATLGILGAPFSSVERGIAISVLFFGLLMLVPGSLPVLPVGLAVMFFALFHGYAHGVEMPDTANVYLFMAGFAAGTALIHLAGVLIGLTARKLNRGFVWLRFSGCAIAIAGLYFVFA